MTSCSIIVCKKSNCSTPEGCPANYASKSNNKVIRIKNLDGDLCYIEADSYLKHHVKKQQFTNISCYDCSCNKKAEINYQISLVRLLNGGRNVHKNNVSHSRYQKSSGV